MGKKRTPIDDIIIQDCKVAEPSGMLIDPVVFPVPVPRYYGGPIMELGKRQTYEPGSPALTTLEEANRYANSIIYRDLWSFSVTDGPMVKAFVSTVDPIDRRSSVTINQVLPFRLPTTVEEIDHVVLHLICQVENHERLEWLARLRPGATLPEKLFPPHTRESADPFRTNDGFLHGEQIMRDHADYMAERDAAAE